jgi:hypothetical protein
MSDDIMTDVEVRDTLKQKLHEQIVRVVFVKKDGTDRTMLATLKEEFIPEDKRPKGTGRKVTNDNILSVFDVEKDGWRSFDFESVKEIAYE